MPLLSGNSPSSLLQTLCVSVCVCVFCTQNLIVFAFSMSGWTELLIMTWVCHCLSVIPNCVSL